VDRAPTRTAVARGSSPVADRDQFETLSTTRRSERKANLGDIRIIGVCLTDRARSSSFVSFHIVDRCRSCRTSRFEIKGNHLGFTLNDEGFSFFFMIS